MEGVEASCPAKARRGLNGLTPFRGAYPRRPDREVLRKAVHMSASWTALA